MFLKCHYYLSSACLCLALPFTGQTCTSSPLRHIAPQLYCIENNFSITTLCPEPAEIYGHTGVGRFLKLELLLTQSYSPDKFSQAQVQGTQDAGTVSCHTQC